MVGIRGLSLNIRLLLLLCPTVNCFVPWGTEAIPRVRCCRRNGSEHKELGAIWPYFVWSRGTLTAERLLKLAVPPKFAVVYLADVLVK